LIDCRVPDGVRSTIVRAKKVMNSPTLPRWKNPKFDRSIALHNCVHVLSLVLFRMQIANTFIVCPLQWNRQEVHGDFQR